ncbi:MAG TPA: DUF2071 domain-containing protein [Planctomycetota bacterium]|nr:DUF2071 domain-containing protein [Planctomycetota bacterium]
MHPLLGLTDHRDAPPPARPWAMTQRWCDLLFAHWPVPVDVLRALVPAPLEIDRFDGEAWVGLAPFRMENVRLRGTPPMPGLSSTPEVNLRTYVRHRGRGGVYFFSLDAAPPPVVWGARLWFGLPYYRARMRCEADGDGVRYSSERLGRRSPAVLRARYRPTGPAARALPGTLDHFLVERYRLFVVRRGRVRVAEIHHPPWPLQPAEAELQEQTVSTAAGLELRGPPRTLHFARALDTLEWAPRVDD